jgi:hypothetical protein
MAKPKRAAQTRQAGRRATARRLDDVITRLSEIEDVARANRRELDLQFRRIAEMQAEIDRLKKRER